MFIRACFPPRILWAFAFLPLAVAAYADDVPPGFIALHGKHTPPQGIVATAANGSPAVFLPLMAKNFRGLPPAKRLERETELAASRESAPPDDVYAADLADRFSHAPQAALMTQEQAQQIISLFDPDH